MRLVGDPGSPRLVTIRTGRDLTGQMLSWAEGRLKELEAEGLCGFIFKGGSPSSGMERVKVYTEGGMPSHRGRGIFAKAFMERFPLLPVEDEGRLHDPKIRENFVERLFVMQRWREVLSDPRHGSSRLVEFHTKHKLLIMSHSPSYLREMGRMVSGQIRDPLILERYERALMEALSLRATPAKHANVLQHMLGYFKKELSSDEKQEMLELIEALRRGLIPLIVPVTLVRHYVRKYGQPYLKEQVYLSPHPLELQLRNHV
jgi:uncharacterized protein YbgA (DUF1722 family)